MADATFTTEVKTDEASARRAADEIFDPLFKSLDTFLKEFRGSFQSAIRDAARASQRVNAGEGLGAGFKDATQQARLFQGTADELIDDIEALRRRTEAVAEAARKVGINPDTFAVQERQLRRLASLQTDIARDFNSLGSGSAAGKSRLAVLEAEFQAIRRGLIDENNAIQSGRRDLNTAITLEARERLQAENRASRERIAQVNRERGLIVSATQAEGAQRLAETRIAGQRQIAAERASQRRRIETFRFAVGQIRALERSLATVFSGTARAIGASFRGVGNTLAGVTAALRRNNDELTQGLGSSLSRREQLITGSFRQQEVAISRSLQRQQATIERFERASSTGIAGALTGRSAAGRGLSALGIAGGVGGGILGANLLSSGFQRFSDLERLEKQFLALTQSASDTQLLLTQVADFAKTTPFDLIGVADLAKGFLAIGTATEEVIPRVKTIADAVALTGGGTDALNRIQRAIGQIISTGKLQGDELNQLAENLPGLNIRQLIADRITGGNVQEVVKLQESGELTADIFLEAFLGGLSTDPRLVGASQDLANTVGGRVANLKESFADFGAAIIGIFAEQIKTAVSITQTVLQEFADFIRGDVTGALAVLRQALIGASVAIGGLLIARAAGEAIKFLALAVRSALTPFGLFVTAVAAIGAAVAILRNTSPEFKAAIDSLVDLVRNALGPTLDFIGGLFNSFVDILTDTVVPAVSDFAVALVQRVEPAIRSFAGFIRDRLLPAIGNVASFVTDTLIPVVADGLATAFGVALRAVQAFWDFVQPIIQPAIDGFAALGSAIATAFTGGDFSAIVDGLRAVATGVGGALSNIGNLIIDALRPAVETARDFLVDFFSADNLKDIGVGFLGLVEEIGFILGNIATDRRFLTALAGIAAAAALVAVNFIKGLARGILDNVPDLIDAVRDLASIAVREFLDALIFDPVVIGAVLTAAFLAPRVLAAWRKVGADGATAFATGFAGSVAGSARRSSGFVNAFIGGPAQIQASIADAGRRLQRGLTQEFQRINRQINALGGTAPAFRFGQVVTQEDVNTSRARLAQLQAPLSQAQIAGANLRASLGSLLSGNVRIALGDLAASVRQQGAALGNTLGNAILSGVGSALSGQALGSSSSGAGQAIGLAGIVSSALFAGASAGAFAVPVGAAVAGLGLVTAAFAANQKAAERAKQEIGEYAKALEGLESPGERIRALADTVVENFRQEGEGTRDLLLEAGFAANDFARQIENGTASSTGIIRDLLLGLGSEGRALFDELNRDGQVSFGELGGIL